MKPYLPDEPRVPGLRPKALAWCLMLVGMGLAATAHATSPDQVADQLTKAVQSKAACTNFRAALWCSGVIAMPASAIDTSAPASVAAYVRSDRSHATLGFQELDTSLTAPYGLVFTASALSAISTKPEASGMPACVLPVPTALGQRTAVGCWPAGHAIEANDTDLASCDAMEVTTEKQWTDQSSKGAASVCSFSAWREASFDTALRLNTAAAGKPPLVVLFRPWTRDIASQLTEGAWVYPKGNKAALQAVQAARLTSGARTLPILSYDAEKLAFTYDAADNTTTQPEQTIVKRLTDMLMGAGVEFAYVPIEYAKDFYHPPQYEKFHHGKIFVTNTGMIKYDDDNSQTMHVAFQQGTYGVVGDWNHELAIFFAGNNTVARGYALRLQAWYATSKSKDLPLVSNTTPDDNPKSFFGLIQTSNPYKKAAQVAADLKKRFDDTRPACAGNLPAFYCTGLIVRTTSANPDHAFTLPDSDIKHGVGSFSFIRKDTHTVNLFKNHFGFIVQPSSKLTDQVACIYPLDADSWWDKPGRSANNYQCSVDGTRKIAPTKQDHNGDASSCSVSLATKQDSHTAEEWAKLFDAAYNPKTNFGDAKSKQCSFSVVDPAQFLAAIKVSATNYNPKDEGPQTWNEGKQTWNELILKPWASVNTVPTVEAVFYLAGDDGARDTAKKLADSYNSKTHSDVPVVSIDLKQGIISATNTK